MVILPPRRRDGLAGLEQRLDARVLAKRTSRLRRQQVEVMFPKFHLTSTFRLERTLEVLGMKDAFDWQRADFSGMDGCPHGLFLGAVGSWNGLSGPIGARRFRLFRPRAR